MTTVAIQRLNENVRPALVAHFLALPMKDRYLRFGTSLAPGAITAYVDRIDFERDAVFGVRDDRLALVGAAHLSLEADLAEVGLSVLPMHRRRGVGGALFSRAMAHARLRRMPQLLMRFLSGNVPILRIARKFGMRIIARGSETEAHLALPPTLAASDELARPTSYELYHAARAHRSRVLGRMWSYVELHGAGQDRYAPNAA